MSWLPMTLQIVKPPPVPPVPPQSANHYDWVRWALYIMQHGLLGEFSEDKQRAIKAVIRDEVDARKRYANEPLRFVELWRPECDTCIDWTWPIDHKRGGAVNVEGKPCGKQRPGSNGLRVHGQPMERTGLRRYRCPVCGAEEERTGQWEAVQLFLWSVAIYFLLLGGNRSSKSFTGAVCGAITALGALHPAVVEFLRRNRLDPGRLPKRKTLVLAGSITNEDSRTYLRPKYEAMLPDAWTWTGRYAIADASVCAPSSGPGAPGSILFKSTSGAAAESRWQGTSTPLIHNDEDHGNLKVLEEQVRAVADQGGRWLGTMTPTKGKSPALTDILFRDPPRNAGEVEKYVLDPLDNPMVDGDAMGRWFASMTPRVREVRRFARFVQVEGLVFPEFNPTVHVVRELPLADMAEWKRADGIDFGHRAPFAYVWGAVSPRGVLHVYRVRYERGLSTPEHVMAVTRMESCPACLVEPIRRDTAKWYDDSEAAAAKCKVCNGTGRRWPHPYTRAADTAGAQERADWEYLGIPLDKANKARRASFELLGQLLQMGPDGKPGLVIHDHPSTAPLIKELEELAYKRDNVEGAGTSERQETELDPRTPDHAFDALRYLAMAAKEMQLIETAHVADSC